MSYDPKKHHRRSIRLPGYDYTQPGAYFVTMCTALGECILGDIVDDTMLLSLFGRIAHEEWLRSAYIRQEIELQAEECVVMPNHVHGIVWIVPNNRRTDDRRRGDRPVAPTRPRGPAPRSLGAFIAGYKSAVTKRINQLRQSPGTAVWQRNYWERVVRDDRELARFRDYIATNPTRWELDQLHPAADSCYIRS